MEALHPKVFLGIAWDGSKLLDGLEVSYKLLEW